MMTETKSAGTNESREPKGDLAVIRSDASGIVSALSATSAAGARCVVVDLPPEAVTQIPPKRKWDAGKGAWMSWAKGSGGQWEAKPCDPPTGYVNSIGTGYLNALMGLHVHLPPRLWVEGEERENPCIVRDKRTGIPQSVTVSVTVSGPGLDGTIHARQMLATLPLDVLRRQMLGKLATEGPRGDKSAKRSVRLGPKPPDGSAETWVELGDGLGWLVDSTAPDVAEVYNEWLQIATTAERRALTIATRNAIQKHPANLSGKGATWTPERTCWTAKIVVWPQGAPQRTALALRDAVIVDVTPVVEDAVDDVEDNEDARYAAAAEESEDRDAATGAAPKTDSRLGAKFPGDDGGTK